MTNSITVIIFGFTGDLAKRKLIPALYALFCEEKIPHFTLIGVGLEEKSTQDILNNALPFVDTFSEHTWNLFCARTFYTQHNILKSQDAQSFASFVKSKEDTTISINRLVYMAVGAQLFEPLTVQLVLSGILEKRNTKNDFWHRIVYEKPFGTDRISAHAINLALSGLLYEEQIFRIDHYLTKELVSNISLIRFTNCIFEPLWNNKYIEQVHIILNETIDIENRGYYYDQFGALKDVVQNHMLQMLALIAMEAPESLLGDAIRNKRAALLEQVYFVDGIRGQYAGYLNENGVTQNSQTETYALLELAIKNNRWEGVPFFFSTGKALASKEVAIHVFFKPVDCLLEEKCSIIGPTMEPNVLTFKIAPEEFFSLQLNVKKPGTADMVMPVLMNLSHDCFFALRQSHAYEVLIEEVIKGEQASSVRFDEIESAWRIIDQIEQKNIPLSVYQKGSNGPDTRIPFMKNHKMRLLS